MQLQAGAPVIPADPTVWASPAAEHEELRFAVAGRDGWGPGPVVPGRPAS
jgi:hypothetical protein